MPKFIDRTGLRVGRLVVSSFSEKRGSTNYWNCVCDCGREKVVSTLHLGAGTIQSCGCLQKDRASAANLAHGMAGTKEYDAWLNMKARCSDPLHKEFPNYGGRGIRVCGDWLESPKQFLADMGKCPPGLTLERIDCNGHYEPSNCRWASTADQARNKRSTRLITANGKTMCVADWAAELGVTRSIITHRINRHGWDPVRAVTTPVHLSATSRKR